MKLGRISGCIVAVLIATSLPDQVVNASERTSPTTQGAIQDAVYNHLLARSEAAGDDVEIMVNPVDPRLRLKRCPVALILSSANKTNRSGIKTVEVRCPSERGWKVQVRATVKTFRSVAVSAKPIDRGAVVSGGDIRMQRMDVSRLHGGYITAAADAVGKLLKRRVREGMVLGPRQLVAANAVNRGDDVTLVTRLGQLEVRSQGVALLSGAVGRPTKVRALSSGKVVQGVIISHRTVQVN